MFNFFSNQSSRSEKRKYFGAGGGCSPLSPPPGHAPDVGTMNFILDLVRSNKLSAKILFRITENYQSDLKKEKNLSKITGETFFVQMTKKKLMLI